MRNSITAMLRRAAILLPGLGAALVTTGCGGGGGDGGGSPPPPPPPPPAAVTYTLTLTGIDLDDTRGGVTVDPSGLPIDGARATRQP